MASKIATKAATTKPNKQLKRKMEIKDVEQDKRYMTFSKRKQGLYKKVAELSLLSEVKIALIITSPNNNLYACGYPNADTVIQHFLAGENPFSSNQQEEENIVNIETLRFQYKEIQDQLKEEKKKLKALTKSDGSCSSSWWDLSVEEISMEYLEQFKNSVEQLKLNVDNAMEAMIFSSLEPLPLDVSPPPPTLSSYSLLSDCFLDQQVNSNNAADAWDTFMVSNCFAHYY